MSLKLYEVVRLRKALRGLPIPIGAVGTIVLIYDRPRRAYEVEFVDGSGRTLGLATVEASDIERVT